MNKREFLKALSSMAAVAALGACSSSVSIAEQGKVSALKNAVYT